MNEEQVKRLAMDWGFEGTFPQDPEEWLMAEACLEGQRQMAMQFQPLADKIQTLLQEADSNALDTVAELVQGLEDVRSIATGRLQVIDHHYDKAREKLGSRVIEHLPDNFVPAVRRP